MIYYYGLKNIEDIVVRKRTVEGLKRLRSALSANIPKRTTTDTLLLATWNIREFDSEKYGWRNDEPYYYIAEIISRFDLVAIQEVRDGLYPLQRLCRLLGSWWDFLVTDVTLGNSGNSERMAFLYDRRKVAFTGLAAEFVLPKDRGAKAEPVQLARSPYVAGFRAGWAYLTLATVHIYYGKGVKDDPRRVHEITEFSKTLAKHASIFSSAPQYEPGASPKRDNLIMLGDFNIFNRNDVTMRAITEAGFVCLSGCSRFRGRTSQRTSTMTRSPTTRVCRACGRRARQECSISSSTSTARTRPQPMASRREATSRIGVPIR
jgi:hypothetical protein